MSENQKVIQCFHCGNNTLMDMVGEYKENDYEGDSLFGCTSSRMYVCPVCKKVTFFEEYWDLNFRYFDEDGDEQISTFEKILYPRSTFHYSSLPVKIRSAFDAALKCKNIDSSICLIALRRTLEFVCVDKGAIGRDLWRKIESLSTSGVLPPELKHASLITKAYGNMGAHDADAKISLSDLDRIIEFVQYILDYLYILPAKLKEIQDKIGQKQPLASKKKVPATMSSNEDSKNA